MSVDLLTGKRDFDRTNAVLGALVFLGAFVVYAMTVQRSFSFWDCGEFIASAVILGIPHPPGSPLLVLLGRVFSMIPFVDDVSYRINYISVISSAVTALFCYLIGVRLIRSFFTGESDNPLNRLIAYVGGVCGGFFAAFSATNWSNSVEAETYSFSLAVSGALFWLALHYLDVKGSAAGWRIIFLATYVAVLGVGVHLTSFLVYPICAIFFLLNEKAERKDYLMVCLFAVIELFLVIVFSNGRGGPTVFKFVSAALGAVLVLMLYRKIRWEVLIAIAAVSSIMISFYLFLWCLLVAPVVIFAISLFARQYKLEFRWKQAIMIVVAAFLGFSVNFFVPIRSTHNPRIDENNASRGWPTDWSTFISFLDRKQYGSVSMVDRMFERRGTWENQFGRHANMGFYSYFEEQYGPGRWAFIPFLSLGLIGLVVAIRKRLEVGMPFLILILLSSVGLILYMNFADGTKYDFATGDAYLEVRNRDYFFTPAYVFFGLAIGLGVAVLMKYLKDLLGRSRPDLQRMAVLASSVLVFLPAIALGNNYHENDRSKNFLPLMYARNLLDSCPPNSLLFTGGDNDTFPVWCLQEAYNYRKDIRVINLSLLNTDWYTYQMKHLYKVPISLEDDQILWNPYQLPGGQWTMRPDKPFVDRPRGRRTYLHPQFSGSRNQDLMTDEIVLENGWRDPILFSAPPYEGSPLKLREHAVAVGVVWELRKDAEPPLIDIPRSYDLFMNVYSFKGMENSEVFRDDNATGVFAGLAMSSLRVYDELMSRGARDSAVTLMDTILARCPEFWQGYVTLGDLYLADKDTAKALSLYQTMHDTLSAFLKTNPSNQFYMQDLGLAKLKVGQLTSNQAMMEQGINLNLKGFDIDRSSGLAFRKTIQVLYEMGRTAEMVRVAQQFTEYKNNLTDQYAKAVLQMGGGS